jgi:hypothetical protein
MLIAASVVGLSRVLVPSPGSLERALPDYLVVTWYVLLVMGSVACLLGIFWRTAVTGLLIERAGMIFLCAAGLIYSIALLAVGGGRAIPASSFVVGFGLASALRALDIGRILVQIRALTLAREAVLTEAELEGGSKE